METQRLGFTILKPLLLAASFLLFCNLLTAQTGNAVVNLINKRTDAPVPFAACKLNETGQTLTSNENGELVIRDLKYGNYTLVLAHLGFKVDTFFFLIAQAKTELSFRLTPTSKLLDQVEIKDNGTGFSTVYLKAIEGTAIYAGKKTEVITIAKVQANLATNNARQIYAKVPGLNVWESDGAGIQLGIGARGLSPNRTSHFNVRQNGYDISADALGYPESYYSPPAEALASIQLVRGAASLQYGTQFGGMLNFKFKEGVDSIPFQFTTRNTAGSFQFFNSFNSIGGTHNKLRYYAFYQYKRGNGWRPNSGFDLHTAYGGIELKATKKATLKLEYTHMNYLAQQPGGLTDAQFENDPRQSIRARNWFKVDWNVLALVFDLKLSNRTTLNSKTFGVFSGRSALGILERVNVIDFGKERDLIQDQYLNFGNETRLIHKFEWFGNPQAILVGWRYYQGLTERQQGRANANNGPDFYYLNPDNLEGSDYRFPSRNVALFTEHIFRPHAKVSIVPGMRFEFIDTRADGFYKQRVLDAAGNVVVEESIEEQKQRKRAFVLFGIGLTYQPNQVVEVYSNISQNYRSITFNDLRIVNPNFAVDENLEDERGFNFDLGARGTFKDYLTFDVSGFYLFYARKIGLLLQADQPPLFLPYRLRTNIADARTFGLESFVEFDLLKAILKNPKFPMGLAFFSNITLQQGKYINTDDPSIRNRQVELVPPMLVRSGLQLKLQQFEIGYQFSYVKQHYTDATNAERTSTAVNGIIPSYYVMDISASYSWRWISLEAGTNNLTDNRYFTRRAEGYPGPGIIPADGRSFYLTLQFQIGAKGKP